MEEQISIEQMTVLMVEPGYEPYEKTIPNTLAAKQELVGGLITAIYPYEEMVAIVANDEGILLGMDFNRSVEGGYGGVSARKTAGSSFRSTLTWRTKKWMHGCLDSKSMILKRRKPETQKRLHWPRRGRLQKTAGYPFLMMP